MTHHEHELMLSTTVHAMFGYTLILAGLTRLIEVCFVVPSYPPADGVENDRADYTLADGAGADSAAASKGRAFRHMLPFVSRPDPFLFHFPHFSPPRLRINHSSFW
jgi:Protein of unknown function (Ytp1)